MKSNDVQGGIVVNSADVALPPLHDERTDKWIRFYKSKFHLISVPVGIVFSLIHLRFALNHLGQCTIQPMVNIYMITHASITLFLILLACIGMIHARCIYPRCTENDTRAVAHRLIFTVVILTLVSLLVSLAWLLAGSVWVFSAKSNGVQGSDPTLTSTYCQSELYRAAFVLIIVNYVVHGLIILVFIVKYLCRKKECMVPPLVLTSDRA